MKRLLAIGGIVAALNVLPAITAHAAANPSNTGQPSQSCQQQTTTPGNAASAPGSAFNPNGASGAVYAGSPGTPSAANGNAHAVAQYDVACYQVSH